MRSHLLLVTLAGLALGGCGLEFPPWRPSEVRRAPEQVVVSAWAEPARLPARGGQTHILVRLTRANGAPFAGVEVRIETTTGKLYSKSHILVSDARGRTRDRLTTRRTAEVTINAGGTRYRFPVHVGQDP